jgi:branched-chain amino acid transport system substrate-binding protein
MVSKLATFFVLIVFSTLTQASDPIYIGLDAEFGLKSSTSAQAIQQGIQIALDEVNQSGGLLGEVATVKI